MNDGGVDHLFDPFAAEKAALGRSEFAVEILAEIEREEAFLLGYEGGAGVGGVVDGRFDFEPVRKLFVVPGVVEKPGLAVGGGEEPELAVGAGEGGAGGADDIVLDESGYTGNIVIVDEAAIVEDDVIGAASPTLSRTNGKLWLLSTPHGQTGLFYNVWHDKDLTDWFKVKATIEDSAYATPEFIAEQKRLFPFNVRQDFYCEFTPKKGCLLSRERVEKMIDPTITHIPFPRLLKDKI